MLDWLWPIECAGCEREGMGRVCPTCAGEGPFPADEPPEGIRGAFHLGTYDGPLGNAVRRAKYGPDRHIALALARLLASRSADLPPVDFVVPAPSMLRNRIARGFAISAVLAGELARTREVPVRHALTLAAGPKQAASNARQRRANLVGRVHAVPRHPRRMSRICDTVRRVGRPLRA